MAEEHKEIDKLTGTATTGHEWDGIHELNTPLPRWWLWTFYACIVWAIGYWVLYPAWPLVTMSTQGITAWHARSAVVGDLDDLKALRGPMMDKLTSTPVADIVNDAQLLEAETARAVAHMEKLAYNGVKVVVYGECAGTVQGQISTPVSRRPRFTSDAQWQGYAMRLNAFGEHLQSRPGHPQPGPAQQLREVGLRAHASHSASYLELVKNGGSPSHVTRGYCLCTRARTRIPRNNTPTAWNISRRTTRACPSPSSVWSSG